MPSDISTYPLGSAPANSLMGIVDVFSTAERREAISTFAANAQNGTKTVTSLRTAYLIYLRTSHLTDEHFLPLLMLVEGSEADEAGMRLVIETALKHSDCPPALLTQACRGRQASYAVIAAQHPNCPDEDAVYSVLTYSLATTS